MAQPGTGNIGGTLFSEHQVAYLKLTQNYMECQLQIKMNYEFVYRTCMSYLLVSQHKFPVLETLLWVLDARGRNQKTCLPISLSVRCITPRGPQHPSIPALIEELLWRWFVDVIKFHNQSTLSKACYPR